MRPRTAVEEKDFEDDEEEEVEETEEEETEDEESEFADDEVLTGLSGPSSSDSAISIGFSRDMAIYIVYGEYTASMEQRIRLIGRKRTPKTLGLPVS